MTSALNVYLDIETAYNGYITVIGLYRPGSALRQLIRGQHELASVLKVICPCQKIYTFNGHSFDLRIIRDQLGVDLRSLFESIDLMHTCRAAGLRGGQKELERQFGIVRCLPDMDGRDAQRLWHRYETYGDKQALATLLLYNTEDVQNLHKIYVALRRRGIRV